MIKKSKEYLNNNNLYSIPIKIGDEVFPTTCFGYPYMPEDFDKCCGYKVTYIRIKEDGIYFDIAKDKNNDISTIPLDYIGIFFFLNEEDTKKQLEIYKKENIRENIIDKYLNDTFKN